MQVQDTHVEGDTATLDYYWSFLQHPEAALALLRQAIGKARIAHGSTPQAAIFAGRSAMHRRTLVDTTSTRELARPTILQQPSIGKYDQPSARPTNTDGTQNLLQRNRLGSRMPSLSGFTSKLNPFASGRIAPQSISAAATSSSLSPSLPSQFDQIHIEAGEAIAEASKKAKLDSKGGASHSPDHTYPPGIPGLTPFRNAGPSSPTSRNSGWVIPQWTKAVSNKILSVPNALTFPVISSGLKKASESSVDHEKMDPIDGRTQKPTIREESLKAKTDVEYRSSFGLSDKEHVIISAHTLRCLIAQYR